MKDPEIKSIFSNNENEGFHVLFNEFYIPLCVYAMRFIRNKAITEEIVQDIFLKLWEQKENLENISSLSSYLYKMVKNNCLNYLKHLQVINKYNAYYSQLLTEAEDYYTITRETGQSILIAREIEQKIYDAIELLPEQCREIFKLSRLEGLKNQEIADQKGITIHTVQKQISIALIKLREILKPLLPFLLFTFITLKDIFKNI